MSNDDTKADIAEKAAILTQAALRAADQLGVCSNVLGKILGVSATQISRFKTGTAVIDPRSKAGELAGLFLRANRSLMTISGGNNEVARSWVSSQNIALGARPVDQMTTVQGLVQVVAYLDTRCEPI